MHLKSIEINGFKSFANKLIFEFPHGITGIVGPNGSGKSNIGDAVRWVLGEQSAKQLRGSRMEDVIFSGTENRKPLGFAYVAMVFDNADRRIGLDYDEVKVARRVYRSGESEYLINGAACRRRDIIEIFYDTGIGKEGYSIIGQGQVEKILSGKIEDSRELFDEAAGIAKYKKNRTVTEKSLEQEHQNLERVTDILKELEQRVGPLESQSKKAREYLKLREKEKDLDVHLFIYDQDRLSREKMELERQQDITGRDLEETREDARSIKEQNVRIGEEISIVSRETEEAEALREENNNEKELLESRRQELKLKIESNLRLNSHYQELIKNQKKEEEEKLLLILQHKDNKTELSRDIDNLKKKNQDQELDLEVLRKRKEALSREAEGKRDRLFSMISSNSDAKEKMSRLKTMEEQLTIRNAEYNSRLIAFQSDLKGHQEKETVLKAEYDRVLKEESDLSEQEEKLTRHKEELREQERSLSKKHEQENQEMLRARSRYETLRNISERYDGYQNSIRHVMEQKKNYPGILGVVADILTMEKKYETAIEIALGGALQNIVTEDNGTAKEMIAFLKKNRLGRATFLPLSNIRKRNITISPYVLEEEGVIGIASSLVQTDKRYMDLVVSLLGRTVVVDDIDHALLLNRKNNFSLRIVTLDGELLNPGGAITGGAFRHSGNLLGRKREVEECRERMNEKKSVCSSLLENLNSVREQRRTVIAQLDELSDQLSQWRLKLHDLKQQLPEITRKKQELDHSILSLKAEHKILKEQIQDILIQMEDLAKVQETSEKLHEENHSVIDRLNRQLEDIDARVRTQEDERNQLVLEISRKEQQHIFQDSEIRRLEQEIESLRDEQLMNQKKADDLTVQNQTLKSQIDDLERHIGNVTEKLLDVAKKLDMLKTEQKRLQTLQSKIFGQLSEKNERLILLEKENDRISNRLEKIAEQLSSQIDHMWDQYEITYNYALELKKYDITAAEVSGYRKDKKEIERKIRQLGNVNINAIEEYKEVGERYEFMRNQYEDICKAEDNLKEMIKELNLEMKKVFTEQFSLIRTAFQNVFGDLFEGGKADLELMDEENILECGIRIVAQPPGKKLQNILLLSGGERALTAIALLFAIQQLKPSPFCLLDEIEAALDDANIIRFSKYLKKLSKDTQFIVITHRRGTMTAAEALYGITMQEKGVSTLISVDLIDKQLEA